MIIKNWIIFLNLIILIDSALHPLVQFGQTKTSKCIADILNTIPSRDVHFLIITTNFVQSETKYFSPFYLQTSLKEISRTYRLHGPRSYSVISSSDLVVKCIQNREINVYIIFLDEYENFAALLTAVSSFCSWNPIAKLFILIRHYEAVPQNHVYFELFRRLVFNVIVVEISSLEQNLISVNMI